MVQRRLGIPMWPVQCGALQPNDAPSCEAGRAVISVIPVVLAIAASLSVAACSFGQTPYVGGLVGATTQSASRALGQAQLCLSASGYR